ncbi:MAG: hypothetical protein AAB262_05810 [Elusimicrobiota bacterium]
MSPLVLMLLLCGAGSAQDQRPVNPLLGEVYEKLLEELRSGKHAQKQGAVTVPRHISIEPSKAVARLCHSSLPVLIVDNFVSGNVAPAIDVDGDGRPDVEHGDVIAALYKAQGIPFLTHDLKGRSDFPSVAEAFREIADDVEAGRLRISAVNLSYTLDVTWPGINGDLGLKAPVTPESIGRRRIELALKVTSLGQRNDLLGFDGLYRELSRLAAAEIPIFVSAGNHSPAKVNLLSLLPGTVSVGALDRSGAKAAFSADNSLVTSWALGVHVFRRVADGVDSNGDGRAEIASGRLSGGATIASQFVGRPLLEVRGTLPSDPWLANIDRKSAGGIEYLQSQMPNGLYPVEELASFFKLSEAKKMSFVSLGSWFDKTMKYPFEVDDSGRVVFDPERSGASGQATHLMGTSFATPSICREGPWRPATTRAPRTP